jgi:membrane dipeptidase
MTRGPLLAWAERALAPAKRVIVTALATLSCALLVKLPALGAETGARPFAVIDLHVDLPFQFGYRSRAFERGTGQFIAADLARAGVAGVVLPLYVPRKVSPTGPRLSDLEDSYARVFGALAATSPFRLPGCLPGDGGVKTWLAFEGSGPLAKQPEAIVSFAARGLRVLGLVHTFHNELASSSGEPRASFGLTPVGEELVRRAFALRVVPDVSHASERATREVAALAKVAGRPMIATHSNARALADHPRNLSDAELRLIAETGGVVGVNFHAPYLRREGRATVADVVRHVRHLLRVMGPRHVALGSDFEGDITPATGLETVAGYQVLARALLDDGLPKEVVEGVFSRNALRVLCE